MAAFGLGLLVHENWFTPAGSPSLAGSRPVRTPADRDTSQGKWGKVQFVVDGPAGTPREVELPAVDGPDPDEFFRSQPPLPPNIERELRRLGHRVETRRQFVPVPLEDGRRVLFPVDNVDIRLFGGQGYQ